MKLESPELYCGKYFKHICKNYRSFEKSYGQTLRLVVGYFDDRDGVIKPPQLILLHACETHELWKIRGVMVTGLRASQWPRMWFGVDLPEREKLIPLVLDSHQNGSADSRNVRAAQKLLNQYLGTKCDKPDL